jgi:hypothetical protein
LPKIITIIPVKNDAWFIEKSIRSSSEWSDYVIIADESSTDGSHEIYRMLELELDNIYVTYNRPKFDFTTPDLRNYLLGLARNFPGNNLIFEMHADEIMSAEIFNSDLRERLLEQSPVGSAIMMPWVNLWKNPIKYREDASIWSGNNSWFAYRDDRRVKFEGEVFHGPRAPESFLKNKVYIDYLQVMHYQFVNISMERSKQALYHIYERNHYPSKNTEYINKIYACAFDERSVVLKNLEIKHYALWIQKGIKIDEKYDFSLFNWRDAEVLKNFDRFGVYKYKNLNIWFIDWEQKRVAAEQLKIKGIPKNFIVDPRGLSDRWAHKFLMKYQVYPFWRFEFHKLLFEKFMERVKKN